MGHWSPKWAREPQFAYRKGPLRLQFPDRSFVTFSSTGAGGGDPNFGVVALSDPLSSHTRRRCSLGSIGGQQRIPCETERPYCLSKTWTKATFSPDGRTPSCVDVKVHPPVLRLTGVPEGTSNFMDDLRHFSARASGDAMADATCGESGQTRNLLR